MRPAKPTHGADVNPLQPAPDTPPPVTVVYAFLDLDDGGAQRLALRSARGLDPSAFRARVLCVRRRGRLAGEAEAAGLPVAVLGRMERPMDAGAVLAIARWLRRVGAGVVHVSLYSRASPYVRLAARLARAPLVVAHEHCRAAPPRRLRRWADRALARGTCFVAVSRADRDALVAAGAAANDVHVIYPGIDVAAFAPRDRDAARASLGWPADRPIVLVPARLHPMKRHVDLIAALPALVARVPGIWVVCAGSGPLATVLPALASAAGAGDHVSFVGPRSDMPTLMAAADVVALCSGAEGTPAALIEAQVAARCVVATAVGGVPEVVTDGVTGRLVAPRAPAALAGGLAEVLGDPVGRAAMARRARAAAVARFDAGSATRALERLYRTELARRGVRVAGAPAADATDAAVRAAPEAVGAA